MDETSRPALQPGDERHSLESWKARYRSIAPWLQRLGLLVLTVALGLQVLSGSVAPPAADTEDKVRTFSRSVEFDFTGWMLHSLEIKFLETSLSAQNYLSAESRHDLVVGYLGLLGRIRQQEDQLNQIYSDPNVADPRAASAELRAQLDNLYEWREQYRPVAEAVLQNQVNNVAAEVGLTIGGQAFPPVFYRTTPLPLVLIASPRTVIREDAHLNLIPDLPLNQQVEMEERVDRALNVSSLIERLGGVGLYPTMVQQTGNLEWLCEVVSHEWIHNYLTLHPLGMSYLRVPEIRTMNETTASIAGKEMGLIVLERYYPELVPPPAPAPAPAPQPAPAPAEPPAFNFNKEMHETRVNVDKMLAEGKVEEAEAYMEARRKIFWDNGYGLRKLNQAYFAFHGAYADQPLGAAGEDPVGAAVRALRVQSPSLAAFINQIAWMTSYEQLKQAVGGNP